MQIRFKTKEIKELFEDFAKMKKIIGDKRTRLIKKQFDRIRAARNMGEFFKLGLGKPHRLSGNYDGCYGVHVDANFRLIIRPLLEGNQEVSVCEIVRVEKMEDYHG